MSSSLGLPTPPQLMLASKSSSALTSRIGRLEVLQYSVFGFLGQSNDHPDRYQHHVVLHEDLCHPTRTILIQQRRLCIKLRRGWLPVSNA